MSLEVTVLGCGNSTGVPAIGNYWGKCDSHNPKNRRTRSSIYVKKGSGSVIIDTGPDFKYQINREEIQGFNAVLYTHSHSDHVDGMSELRVIKLLQNKDKIPVFLDSNTCEDLRSRFRYLFDGGDDVNIYPPILDAHVFEDDDYGRVFTDAPIDFVPFKQDHGTCATVGYRFNDFAYSVDMLTLDDQAVGALKGVKYWIVDCAGYGQKSNPVHANLQMIERLNERIGAKEIYLTSLTLAADYQTLLNELPEHIRPAYDGLKLIVD